MSENLRGKISAPYNFAPLSEHVFLPDWADKVSIDVPMDEGLSGTLDFTITAHSPLLVGEKANEKGPVEPFKFPDGRYGIPGSSVRGMLRNVVEIAAFGKMSLVDDKRYGVRDLTPGARRFYGNRMTENAGGRRFKPKSKAGWLKFSGGQWLLLPCEFSRVEHREINRYLGGRWVAKPLVEDKYAVWKGTEKPLSVLFSAEEAEFHKHSRGNQLFYSKVLSLGTGSQQGEIVFTGQPGPNKHMEFVFHGSATNPIEIPERVIQGFLEIHRDTGEKNDIKRWNALSSMGFPKGIPVFYLEKDGIIESLGLSLMYKLAYINSIGAVVERVQGKFDADKPDLAELIFGYVDEGGGLHSLKGRVSFANATCEQSPESIQTQEFQTILNGPKPTYYPNYLVQQQKDGKLLNPTHGYATLMDTDATIRGWKRYPVRPNYKVTTLTKEQQENKDIQVSLKPIIPSPVLSFRSRLRYHNLKKCELGAIVWAMGWGGKTQLRHAIGMGKSFGFGQISISLDPDDQQYIAPNDFSEPPSLSDCTKDFEGQMEAFCKEKKTAGGWYGSDQLIQLMAMANPEQAPGLPGALEHLDLRGGGKNNEFVLAKKDYKVLEPYIESSHQQGAAGVGGDTDSMPWDDSEAGEWLRETVEDISKKTNTPEKKKVLHAKRLAERWSEIAELELKGNVLALIRDYWQSQEWWETPHGKSAIQAYRIYNG